MTCSSWSDWLTYVHDHLKKIAYVSVITRSVIHLFLVTTLIIQWKPHWNNFFELFICANWWVKRMIWLTKAKEAEFTKYVSAHWLYLTCAYKMETFIKRFSWTVWISITPAVTIGMLVYPCIVALFTQTNSRWIHEIPQLCSHKLRTTL